MFVCLYKPKGISSFKVLSALKKRLNTNKVGHMGTLDPLAEGVLPVAVGKYTKLIPYVNLLPKQYQVEIFFGLDSKTLDSEGVNLETLPEINLKYSIEELQSLVETFLGEIQQVPPKFSAIKIDGKRAYKLARENNLEESQIKPRLVELFSVSNFKLDKQILSFTLECGSGFYVRSLVRDIGLKLDLPCFMLSLKRTKVGAFSLSNACDSETVSALNLDLVIPHVSKFEVDEIQSNLIKNGMPLEIQLADGFYWVFDSNNELAFCSSSNNILTVIRRLC